MIEAKIGDGIFCELIMGQSPPGETYNKDKKGLPFYQGKADFGLVNPIPDVWCTVPKKIAEPNDILLSVRAPVGPTNIANEKCSIGRGLAIVRPTEKLDFEYLLFILRKFELDIASVGSGSTFDSIGKEELRKIVFPVPKLKSDQQRIASEIKEKLATVEQMRQAAVKQKEVVEALQGALLREVFPFKFGDKLPGGWRWEKIANLIIKKIKIFTKEDFEEFGYIDISAIDSFQKKISNPKRILVKDSPGRAKFILNEGDILISNVRPNLNAVAIVTEEYSGSVGSSGFTVIRPSEAIYAAFLFLFFTSPYFINYVTELVQGAMYPAMNEKDVYRCPIPIPSFEKQKEIYHSVANQLNKFYRINYFAGIQLEAIEALPAAILREVFEFKS